MLAGAIAATTESVPDLETLAALLTAEGLLFAALAISFDRLRPDGKLQLFLVSPAVLGYLAVAANVAIASGGLVLWKRLFIRAGWKDWPNALVAVAVFVAIVAPPMLSVLLASGLRRNRE